ncbi:MAG: DUF2846 domain-containing protein [Candidatus Saccharibacteria bacterium]|nr:DUF2846 domain-containing protein [Rhodoferax sp.]
MNFLTNARRLVLAATVGAALVGCATATGPQFTNVQSVSGDSANVYVYRKDRSFAMGQSFDVALDKKPAGNIVNASFMLLNTVPGKHTVAIHPGLGTSFPLEMSLEAGKTYFAEFELTNSLLANPLFIGSKLLERTQGQALEDLKTLKAAK